MNSLSEDLEEVEGAPERVLRFIRNARRAHGITRNDPTCWFAQLEQGDDPAYTITLGRSPGDVLLEAKAYADAHTFYRRIGTGRWIIESGAGDEETASLVLVVFPKLDEEGNAMTRHSMPYAIEWRNASIVGLRRTRQHFETEQRARQFAENLFANSEWRIVEWDTPLPEGAKLV